MGSNENSSAPSSVFESKVYSEIRNLRNNSDLFDITLGCTDSNGRTLQAHKIILSACSAFFRNLLCQQASYHNNANAYVYLKGVAFKDLSIMLDYMYHGEVKLPPDDLDSFLSIGEELQITGISTEKVVSGAPRSSVTIKPDYTAQGSSIHITDEMPRDALPTRMITRQQTMEKQLQVCKGPAAFVGAPMTKSQPLPLQQVTSNRDAMKPMINMPDPLDTRTTLSATPINIPEMSYDKQNDVFDQFDSMMDQINHNIDSKEDHYAKEYAMLSQEATGVPIGEDSSLQQPNTDAEGSHTKHKGINVDDYFTQVPMGKQYELYQLNSKYSYYQCSSCAKFGKMFIKQSIGQMRHHIISNHLPVSNNKLVLG